MKKRIIWLSLALAAGPAGHAFAQGAGDALRYSRLQFGGPARSLGIGGANVAVGADFGNLTSNPAGLGMYQKSELHFTPGFGLGQSNASIEGNASGAQNATKNSFHVGSTGVVLTNRRPDSDQSTNWRGGALALGFTRVADFNTASRYEGQLTNRLVDGQMVSGDNQSYLASLRGTAGLRYYQNIRSQGNSGNYNTVDNGLDGLAYGAYLINVDRVRVAGGTINDSTTLITTRQRRGPIGQSNLTVTQGSASQFDLGYGASYRDRLYIGAGAGIVSSNYKYESDFTETESDPTTHLNSYTLREDRTVSGTGFNARLGFIYRATDNFRVGASVQTPTFMRLLDTYNASFTTDFSDRGTDAVPRSLPIGVSSVDAETNDYAYRITTPFRANGGVAYTIGKLGFISGDVEYVGYGQARLNNDMQDANGDNYSFSAENSDIKNRYQNAVNVRVGAEGRFDVFRARLGYARYGNPYVEDNSNERGQNFYTGGLGIRQGNFFIDAAAVYSTFNQVYTPYTLANKLQPVIKVNNTRFTTSLTAGITF